MASEYGPGNFVMRESMHAMLIALAAAALVDLVLVNGRIWSNDQGKPEVQALAAAQGRIVATGTSAAMRALAGPPARVIDLRRRRALPGVHDSHTHVLEAGLRLLQGAPHGAGGEEGFRGLLRGLHRH